MRLSYNRTYKSLDLWRGFAAMWVVLFHAIVSINNNLPIERNFFVEFCFWGDTAVPIFFVISGYCMAAAAANLIERNQTIGRFAIARVRRIYPPHIVVLLFGLSIAASYWIIQQLGIIKDNPTVTWFTHLTITHIVINALLLQVPLHERSLNDVTWTLSYEVAFYAVIAIAIVAFRKQGWQWMLKVLHVVTVVAFLIVLFAPKWAVFPFDQWIGFGEGVLLFDLLCGLPWQNRSVKSKFFYGSIMIIIASLVIAQIQLPHAPNDYSHESPYPWRILITSLFAILFYFLRPFDERMKGSKFLSGLYFVGGFSYSLYLTHFMILAILQRIISRIPMLSQFYIIAMFAELTICIVIAYGFYRLVESRFMSVKAKIPVPHQTITGQIVSERV